jgi:N-terminal half of MaoC dehydratase
LGDIEPFDEWGGEVVATQDKAVETLVTPQLVASKGVWGPDTVSYPVCLSDIRRWSIAVYWPETPPRLFWDEEYARATQWGGIVAPEDFNPFGWLIRSAPPQLPGAQPGNTPRKGENVLNGGQVDTFFVRIRPGDVITERARVADWDERTGRHGLMLFLRHETEWHNQRGELVKRRIATSIWY